MLILTNPYVIKKESPNEGTETQCFNYLKQRGYIQIKKESPNEGTETTGITSPYQAYQGLIKKESPNEGTKTNIRRT